MRKLTSRVMALAAALGILLPATAAAQAPEPAQQPPPPAAPAGAATFCGATVAPPAALPPAGSGPVVWVMGPCFSAQGNVPIVEAQTYLYYIQLRPSQPSQGIWVP